MERPSLPGPGGASASLAPGLGLRPFLLFEEREEVALPDGLAGWSLEGGSAAMPEAEPAPVGAVEVAELEGDWLVELDGWAFSSEGELL